MSFSTNVHVIERNQKTYYIVGTAHVSQKSVDEVRAVIEDVQPDTVCVELCSTRHRALSGDNQWKNMNIFQVIKDGKALFLLANLALSAFQRRMGDELGVKPGAELMEAVKTAEEQDAKLVLADRDIQTTLKRTWRRLGFFKKMVVLTGLTESVFSKEKIEEEELEKLKEQDQLSAMMDEFADSLPQVKETLIDERDLFLASKIREAEGDKVVAVVGAGHVPGIKRAFSEEIDMDALNRVPPAAKWTAALKYVIPLLVLALFYVGYTKHQGQGFEEMLYAWILPNSVMAALFTAIAGGRPLSVLTAFIASPITSLNPGIGAGMVVGLVEAWLRKPTVADCERLSDDTRTFKGFYRNPFTRVLLIFVASSLGSALGSWIGLTWISVIVSRG